MESFLLFIPGLVCDCAGYCASNAIVQYDRVGRPISISTAVHVG